MNECKNPEIPFKLYSYSLLSAIQHTKSPKEWGVSETCGNRTLFDDLVYGLKLQNHTFETNAEYTVVIDNSEIFHILAIVIYYG